ncbi:MAG: DUF6766 family protein [Gaiellaceae bacterium]
MRFLRENSLSIVFGLIFLIALGGQSIAGHHEYNQQQLVHDSGTITYGRYLVSSQFGVAVLENWQSEYLQFFLFIFATVWLFQRGSNESKELEEIGVESDQKQKVGGYADESSPRWARTPGWRLRLYSNSLLILMGAIFLASWFGQSVTGWTEFNDDQLEHHQATVSWTGYLAEPDFWERTLQNWQSEFLAVGSMAVFSIYLRQRGSPESKPVGAPHSETASSG